MAMILTKRIVTGTCPECGDELINGNNHNNGRWHVRAYLTHAFSCGHSEYVVFWDKEDIQQRIESSNAASCHTCTFYNMATRFIADGTWDIMDYKDLTAHLDEWYAGWREKVVIDETHRLRGNV